MFSVFKREGYPGVYHCKAVVVDGAVALVGGANCTNNSQVNGELVAKLTGAQPARDSVAVCWSEAENVKRF